MTRKPPGKDMAKKNQPINKIGVGMPQWLYLNIFGKIVFNAFGAYPYLVGSAGNGKVWRDIDVRLILDDAEYKRIVGAKSNRLYNSRLVAFNMAFAELGKRITGLPIDFQIQEQTRANEEYPNQDRNALICWELNQ